MSPRHETAISRNKTVQKTSQKKWSNICLCQIYMGRSKSRGLNPCVSALSFSFLLVYLLCEEIHLKLLSNSWFLSLPSLLLPGFYPQPRVHLGGSAPYNEPRVNHLQVSPDKSQCVCCAPSKSQQQLQGCAHSGLWHSECWSRWEAMCWGSICG